MGCISVEVLVYGWGSGNQCWPSRHVHIITSTCLLGEGGEPLLLPLQQALVPVSFVSRGGWFG